MTEPYLAAGVFAADADLLRAGVELLVYPPAGAAVDELPETLPELGIGPQAAMTTLAPIALGGPGELSGPLAASRMASPTPCITWTGAQWTAARSENLLDGDMLAAATAFQERVMTWLTPIWGMRSGHFVPGGTIANLTALWAARDSAGVSRIVASESSNPSIAKVARLLRMNLVTLPSDERERLDVDALVDFARRDRDGMRHTAVVLNAGTYSTGGVDPLRTAQRAVSALGIETAWWHVDAAWAGALMLSSRHANLLEGIKTADSVTVSLHKLLFQPAESAIVMFRDPGRAHAALEFAGPGETSQIGLQGSRSDRSLNMALPLLAYGRAGLAAWIDQALEALIQLSESLRARADVEVFATPTTGVLLWRPLNADIWDIRSRLGPVAASAAYAGGHYWIRHVAANPLLDVQLMLAHVDAVLTSA